MGIARAELAMKEEGAEFGVGVEAGLVELAGGLFLNLQVAAVVDATGRLSFGSSSGFPIPAKFAAKLKENREELDRYTHELTGAKKVREEEGRDPEPTAAVIDSQSVKADATVVADTRGYDAGKKINGRKRHIAVDTLGLLLLVMVTAASVQDRDAARPPHPAG